MQTEREFLHDIASPLSTISLNLDFALKQYRHKIEDPSFWKHIEVSKEQVKRLIDMADKRHHEVRLQNPEK
ncbi:MAG: hypothetical protein A2381_18960 [Bdellovibrionales bacterium RIFOXYB1_FULL_37_110]|nr:MAG: hypothetical protein A2181_05270 [Bdellovibrionales bacterium RIFOXYA1_FULL_38_20]OFZ46585.1 MAG: hypothetical protein A2417_13965 [Bdellovibrionales bacterium RIFOXYC1_FULL_37_79]OFZ57707.1 MAG: hypothetical protein A2381_18960 [Bdellovibrionales bacterium RIFOXYB1_FULL_37_110]OFZ62963.1 MAG: hypothetical protein A2577_11615 [Bdellovibrionales bacterium RIFOXYD1_FULL_36_51]